MATTNLPQALHGAYDWTDGGGELAVLASLTGAELDAYCRESAANAVGNDVTDVTEDDLQALAAWLHTEAGQADLARWVKRVERERGHAHAVSVDGENNAEAWWDALRQHPEGAAIEQAIERGSLTAQQLATCRSLPGWASPDAPEFAPHPLLVDHLH